MWNDCRECLVLRGTPDMPSLVLDHLFTTNVKGVVTKVLLNSKKA
jgi:hypothetical protein